MKKLNNKGLSIIELIISIALISVVMMFLYRLMADVTFEKENEYFASLNQETRAQIIDVVQKSVMEVRPIVTNVYASGNTIYFKSSSTTMYSVVVESDKQIALFNSSNSVVNRWTIKTGKFGSPICSNSTSSKTSFAIFKCNIPVYTLNVNNQKYNHDSKDIDNNNTIDDILFTYAYIP